MRKRYFQLRVRFHDWMWKGGATPGFLRRCARRLPLHFSDPYHLSQDEVEYIFATGERVIVNPPWVHTTIAPSTYAAGTTQYLEISSTWPTS